MNEQIVSDQFGEQLSCLMDGELPRDQLRFLLRRMDVDAKLVQCWSRYQLARGSLRRQTTLPLRADFFEILMRRIAAEAVPLARRRGVALLHWAGGGALAAVVAVVALVATRPHGGNMPATAVPSVAAATAATAPIPQDTYSAPSPALANFDYAQPASFDSGAISILRYDLRRRYEGTGVGAGDGFAPYMLPTTPQAQQVTPDRPDPNRPQAPPQP